MKNKTNSKPIVANFKIFARRNGGERVTGKTDPLRKRAGAFGLELPEKSGFGVRE
jgi:hypothetical protein